MNRLQILMYSVLVSMIGSIFAEPVLVPDQYVYPGILFDPAQRISSNPYITGDTIRAMCDHFYDETKIPFDPAEVKDGDVAFVYINYLPTYPFIDKWVK